MVWISRWQSRNRRHETWSPRVYRRQRWAQVRCLQSANICFRQWLGWEEMWKERESEEARERERASERDSQLLNYNISLIEKVFRFICNRFETVQFKLRVFVFVRERAKGSSSARAHATCKPRVFVSVFFPFLMESFRKFFSRFASLPLAHSWWNYSSPSEGPIALNQRTAANESGVDV